MESGVVLRQIMTYSVAFEEDTLAGTIYLQ